MFSQPESVASMFNHHLSLAEPWFLVLLALLPVVWWIGARNLGGLGVVRRWLVLSLRTLVVVLIVLAIAGAQWVRSSDRVTVFYLVDRSLSIPADLREAMVAYVDRSIAEHRRGKDRAGVIVFGRDAAVELPPVGDAALDTLATVTDAAFTVTGASLLHGGVESMVDPEHSNLAAAMKLAQASFPADSARRIVVVSDGNENRGNARQEAGRAARAGIGVDVVAVGYPPRADVMVERLSIPGEVRRGEPFDLRVVVNNTAAPGTGPAAVVPGRLVISRLTDEGQATLSEERVELRPGKQVFSVRQTVDAPDFYTYEARFIPDLQNDNSRGRQPADGPGATAGLPSSAGSTETRGASPAAKSVAFDATPQNNRATAFTHVRGRGKVLIIEDTDAAGKLDYLADRLKLQGFAVDVKATGQAYATLAELQAYDTVLLGNVPREQFTYDQIDMLVRNTQQLGGGLIMLGGPNSFGAGGWTDTELEKAMPVDFRIKNAKIVPVGALVLVIDRSGSMAGEKLEWCKAAAIEALKTMGPRDLISVIAFDAAAQQLVPMTRVGSKTGIARKIRRLAGGGGTNMEPGMVLGYQGLKKVDAAARHMVVLTDGQTTGSGYTELASAMRSVGMTVSTVGVGAGADVGLLRTIADRGGGKLYRVNNARSLPRIFMREARRVARPLIYDKQPVVPQEKFPLEILRGIDQPLPPIRGFVLTTRKSNPLVEVGLLSPKPAEERNATILAAWHYGLGRSVALTTDAGSRWADQWVGTPMYDQLFGQMVRWSMRPTGGSAKFTVATSHEEGEARVVISALDKDDEFLNFLAMSGTAIGPDLEAIPMEIEQTAPGRYVGRFPAEQPGSYFLAISPGADQSPLRMGLNVPYSDEFRDRMPNAPLLRELAELKTTDGIRGELVTLASATGGLPVPEGADADEPGATAGLPSSAGPTETRGASPAAKLSVDATLNPFRHDLPPARSTQDAWPWLVFVAACLFFGDVFFRRVQVGFGWVMPLASRVRDRLLGRATAEPAPESLERLRSRKAAISEQFDHQRAAARYEPEQHPVAHTAGSALDAEPVHRASGGRQPAGDETPSEDAAPSSTATATEETESYTQRLLKAKQKVWDK